MTASLLAEEQLALRDVLRHSLDQSAGPRPFLVGENGTVDPYDRRLWSVLAGEVGLTGLIVPEQYEGSGGTFADLAVVAEALGSSLAAVPFASTVTLATTALLALLDVERPDPAITDLLGRIASGSEVVALAIDENDGEIGIEGLSTTAVHADGAWRLTGKKYFVVDGDSADLLLVSADASGSTALFAVDRGAPGLQQVRSTPLDLTRPLAVIELADTPARLVAAGDQVTARMRTGLDLALIVLAVEQVGGARKCLEDATAYAKQRIQFGKPIASFQAIKHGLVNVLLQVEMASAAAAAAIVVADVWLADPNRADPAAVALSASLARAVCADAYMFTAEETLHVNGGIGFTWEHDAHLHYRRAKFGELFLGTPDDHRDRLAASAGL